MDSSKGIFSILDFFGKSELMRFVGSFQISRLVGKPILGNPTTLSIEADDQLQLRCPDSPSGLRSFSRPLECWKISFSKKVDSIKLQAPVSPYFQGEPFLNPPISLEMGTLCGSTRDFHFDFY